MGVRGPSHKGRARLEEWQTYRRGGLDIVNNVSRDEVGDLVACGQVCVVRRACGVLQDVCVNRRRFEGEGLG